MSRWRLPVVAVDLACVVLTSAIARPARADFPALTHEFTTESYARDPGSLEALRATRGLVGSAGLLVLARAHQPETELPVAQGLGGRGVLSALVSRWSFGADALLDRDGVEMVEYETRLWIGAVVPEARMSLRAVAGFEDDGYAGADLELELAPVPVPLPVPDVDLRPELVVWLRGRAFDSGRSSLNPAAGLALQHLPMLASALALAVTAQSELAEGEPPLSFGMAQVRWNAEASPSLPEDDLPARPGARRRTSPDRAWFAYGAYAFPLDRRHPARLALGFAVRFRQLL